MARACAALVDALPERVADQPLNDKEKYAASWGDPAIDLRCGVSRPSEFGRAAACTTVNGVDWFAPEEQLEAGRDLTLTVVNRAAYVEVRMPGEYWPPATTMADLSAAMRVLRRTGSCS